MAMEDLLRIAERTEDLPDQALAEIAASNSGIESVIAASEIKARAGEDFEDPGAAFTGGALVGALDVASIAFGLKPLMPVILKKASIKDITNQLISEGVISKDETLYIQEYAAGVLAYLQFFYSPLTGELEFFGVDQRHESDIEGLGRIRSEQQLKSKKVPSFNVIGNSPLVLRRKWLSNGTLWTYFSRQSTV